MITYKTTKDIDPQKVLALYESDGWKSYLKEDFDIGTMLSNSYMVYSAWDEERLIGLIRTVGDGVSIQYIQDILVHEDYRNQKIGYALFRYILEASSHIRTLALMTNDTIENEPIKQWYKKVGLKTFQETGVIGYCRFEP